MIRQPLTNLILLQCGMVPSAVRYGTVPELYLESSFIRIIIKAYQTYPHT